MRSFRPLRRRSTSSPKAHDRIQGASTALGASPSTGYDDRLMVGLRPSSKLCAAFFAGQLAGLAATATPASAQIVAFSEDFSSYNTTSMSGNGGWTTHYSSDSWAADGSVVHANTDDSNGTWGSGDAIDNHLTYGTQSWSDLTLDVDLYSPDNDSLGVSFRFSDASNFYLVTLCGGDGYPSTGSGGRSSGTGGTRLYKVSSGTATQIGYSSTTFVTYLWYSLRIVAEGSTLEVWFDDDRNGTFEAGDLLFTATDSTFSSGQISLYSFDNGGSVGSAFDNVTVTIPDLPGERYDRLHPYCLIGMGFAVLEDDSRRNNKRSAGFLVNFGFGLEYQLSERFFLGSQMMFNFLPEETLDEKFFYSWQIGGLRIAF